MKKSTLIIFPLASIVLLVLAFFLVPAIQQSVLGEEIETIIWKGETIDIIKVIDGAIFELNPMNELSVSLSASQGRNSKERGKSGSVTLDLKDVDVSKLDSIELIFNAYSSVVDDGHGSGESANVAVLLKQDGANIYGCGASAAFNQQKQISENKQLSLFKVENKGAGFYRVQSDCGTEVINVKTDGKINVQMILSVGNTQSAYQHSAAAGITIFEIRKKNKTVSESLPTKETLNEFTEDKVNQTELIAGSTLSSPAKEQVVASISENKEQQEQLIKLLKEIEKNTEESQQRTIYIILGASGILVITIVSIIMTRKKR